MSKITRRSFVGTSIQGAAALAAGAAVAGAPQPAPAQPPSEKVVLGLMGAGGRGHALIVQFAQVEGVEVKYLCDADQNRGAQTMSDLEKLQGRAPKRVVEIREVLDDRDVDAIVVATPEQWHALATVWACQAGKDVYVEKNISLAIWEGRKMVEAARKHGRIVQAGTQNRSAPYAVSARDYIAAGELGKVLYVNVYGMLPGVVGGYPRRAEADGPAPPGLDWDRWLGPAAMRPYNREVHRNWYGYWDFSGGNASDAIHTLDLARMVLGDPPHPPLVQCIGGRMQFDDGGQMPDVQIVTYQFERFVMSFLNTGFTPYNAKSPAEVRYGDKFPYWPQNADRIEIFGTRRMMYLGRHGAGWQVFEADGKLVAQDKGYHPDKWHLPNFIQCIRTRNKPNGEVEQGHMSACLEHLANLSYRLGNARLEFDGQTECFVNNDAANQHLKPNYRDPYRVPEEV